MIGMCVATKNTFVKLKYKINLTMSKYWKCSEIIIGLLKI